MTLDDAYRQCQRIARRAASSFYPAFLILPREQRRAMHALYAFNRLTDDISDGPGSDADKLAALALWEARFDEARAGGVNHPVLAAVGDTSRRFRIPEHYLRSVIAGCRMDLRQRRYADFDELYAYCYRVASSVGLACIHVWGFRGNGAVKAAESAGIAMQLTNILRDLGEDRDRGRVYLPADELDRFGCDREAICASADEPSFQALMRFQVDRARQYYAAAGPLEACLQPPGRAVFRVWLRTYRALLERIEAARFDVFSRRVRVPRSEKLALLLRALPVRWGLTRA